MSALLDYQPEFPTLDLDELDQLDTIPLVPAVYVSTFERDELPAILAAALPEVVRTPRREIDVSTHEYQFLDTRTGAACRLVLAYDTDLRRVRARVAELGDGLLFSRIVVACGEWERAGRPPLGTR
jgi:hypothetical protein